MFLNLKDEYGYWGQGQTGSVSVGVLSEVETTFSERWVSGRHCCRCGKVLGVGDSVKITYKDGVISRIEHERRCTK